MDRRTKKGYGNITEKPGFPPNTWDYYLEAPRDWDVDDIDPVGVHRGVKAILMSRGSVNPWWIPDSDNDKKVKISTSFRRVTQALEEVKRFTSESMPDDSQLNAEYNRAEKRASKLHEKLQDACNDLSALASCSDQINFEFYDFILDFVDKVRMNDEARDRANKMKELLSSRGIVTQPTNISVDHLKSQLPIFDGESSVRKSDKI